jgi:HAD superfamily hydrolase (TIGR01509 family)
MMLSASSSPHLESSATFRPRAVVFDLDGLLFNTEELYCEAGNTLLGRRGKCFSPELIHATMGRPGRVAFQIMIDWHGLTDSVECLAEESEQIFAAILAERLAPMRGASELLERLEAANIPKAIATSSDRRYAHGVLSRFDFLRRFEFVLTCEDVIDGKPHPEIYLKAASRLGHAPRDVLVLEDSQNGCRAAVAAGAFAVAVPGDHSRHHDFTGAALVIDHLADPRLHALVSGHGSDISAA